MSVYADGSTGPYPLDARVGPTGWAPWPEELGKGLRRVHDALPRRDLLVTGFGCATAADDPRQDEWRVEVVQASVEQIRAAVADGVPVRGALHRGSGRRLRVGARPDRRPRAVRPGPPGQGERPGAGPRRRRLACPTTGRTRAGARRAARTYGDERLPAPGDPNGVEGSPVNRRTVTSVGPRYIGATLGSSTSRGRARRWPVSRRPGRLRSEPPKVPILAMTSRSRTGSRPIARRSTAVVTTIGSGPAWPERHGRIGRTAETTLTVEDPVILLVEDDDGDALLVRELMADGIPGAKIRWARSLREAIAEADIADCALLDLGLPDTSGTEGVAALLAAAGHLAVVVLTGADSQATGAAALGRRSAGLPRQGPGRQRLAGPLDPLRPRTAPGHRVGPPAGRRRAAPAENARMERALLRPPLVRSNDVNLSIRYRPARAGGVLGGDFYDAIETRGRGPARRHRRRRRPRRRRGRPRRPPAQLVARPWCWPTSIPTPCWPPSKRCCGPSTTRRPCSSRSARSTSARPVTPWSFASPAIPPPFLIDDGSAGGDGADRTVTLAAAAPGHAARTVPRCPAAGDEAGAAGALGVLLYTDGLIEGRAHARHPRALGHRGHRRHRRPPRAPGPRRRRGSSTSCWPPSRLPTASPWPTTSPCASSRDGPVADAADPTGRRDPNVEPGPAGPMPRRCAGVWPSSWASPAPCWSSACA